MIRFQPAQEVTRIESSGQKHCLKAVGHSADPRSFYEFAQCYHGQALARRTGRGQTRKRSIGESLENAYPLGPQVSIKRLRLRALDAGVR